MNYKFKMMSLDITRFSLQIMLMHVLTYLIDPQYITTHKQMVRTVIVAILSIFIYYIIFKDYISNGIEKLEHDGKL